MKYKSLITATLLSATLLTTSCRDEFAKINTNPSDITEANIPFLFTQGQIEFEPSDYLLWFYNGKYTSQFVQAYVPTAGFTSTFNEMGASGGQGQQNYKVLRVARDIDFHLSKMEANEAASFVQLRAILNPLIVYMAVFDTDSYGDTPFLEACRAKYTNPMLLTPKFDRMEDLYDIWLSMLDETIVALSTTPPVAQVSIKNQDVIYHGDLAKWLKLSNSLKLKIAIRLLSQDKAKALLLAKEVADSPAGVLEGPSDDFLFNKGIQSNNGDQVYHFGDNAQWGAPNRTVVNFLIKNKDPRVRFFYTKNRFNSKVVQGFFNANKALPAFIEANVVYDVVDGKKVFRSWKGLGEPWIRYYGIPADLGAAQKPEIFGDYFDSNRWKLGSGDTEKTYTPYSLFNEEMIRGRVDYTIPNLPGETAIEDKEDVPWYGLYMSTSEVNLYFAEFKLLGATLPLTAEEYFNKAVRFSVAEYDRVASLNRIPYYHTNYSYDPFEKTIQLVDGEIDAMMANPDYQLTGSTAEKLEKVYIQQYLHFMYFPVDQFVVVRRSGIPKVGSSVLAWQTLIPSTDLPRRMEIGLPNPTDLMYSLKEQSLLDQGFTGGRGITPSLLNSERVWQDVGAPNFGEGPK